MEGFGKCIAPEKEHVIASTLRKGLPIPEPYFQYHTSMQVLKGGAAPYRARYLVVPAIILYVRFNEKYLGCMGLHVVTEAERLSFYCLLVSYFILLHWFWQRVLTFGEVQLLFVLTG